MTIASPKSPTPENAIELDKIYRVMALRLKFLWSAFELSWLLGYRPFYIRDVENPFHKLQYSPADTNYLMKIFEGTYSDIIAPKIEPAVWMISIDLTLDPNDLKEYFIYQELKNNTRKLLYRAREETKKTQFKGSSSTTSQDELNKYLVELLNGDFFSTPKPALRFIKTVLKSSVRLCNPCS